MCKLHVQRHFGLSNSFDSNMDESIRIHTNEIVLANVAIFSPESISCWENHYIYPIMFGRHFRVKANGCRFWSLSQNSLNRTPITEGFGKISFSENSVIDWWSSEIGGCKQSLVPKRTVKNNSAWSFELNWTLMSQIEWSLEFPCPSLYVELAKR